MLNLTFPLMICTKLSVESARFVYLARRVPLNAARYDKLALNPSRIELFLERFSAMLTIEVVLYGAVQLFCISKQWNGIQHVLHQHKLNKDVRMWCWIYRVSPALSRERPPQSRFPLCPRGTVSLVNVFRRKILCCLTTWNIKSKLSPKATNNDVSAPSGHQYKCLHATHLIFFFFFFFKSMVSFSDLILPQICLSQHKLWQNKEKKKAD